MVARCKGIPLSKSERASSERTSNGTHRKSHAAAIHLHGKKASEAGRIIVILGRSPGAGCHRQIHHIMGNEELLETCRMEGIALVTGANRGIGLEVVRRL